ncbi:MAG: hypothetical protein N2320_04515 [Candidatus Bipolaricaulota bacterium]|nr:hypothetical protein [Candidatus Bipolaricaulota bacterium]
MRRALGLVVLGVSLVGAAGELGVRLEAGDRAAALGWIQLASTWGGVALSGRLEGDLLCGCPRRLQVSASRPWGELAAGVEASLLPTGRLDGSASAAWKGARQTGLGLLTGQVGFKGTVVDALGGRFLTGAGWASARLSRVPLWAEGALNRSWPGGSLQVDLRLGLSGPAWASLALAGTGISLELGAESGPWNVQTQLALGAGTQTVTLGLRSEALRAQARLTLRGGGDPSGSATLTATRSPWQGTVVVSFSGGGLDRVTAEVRYTLGP